MSARSILANFQIFFDTKPRPLVFNSEFDGYYIYCLLMCPIPDFNIVPTHLFSPIECPTQIKMHEPQNGEKKYELIFINKENFKYRYP